VSRLQLKKTHYISACLEKGLQPRRSKKTSRLELSSACAQHWFQLSSQIFGWKMMPRNKFC